MEDRIRSLELEMKTASGEDLERMLAEYSRLNHQFELENGYACQSEITGVLKGLGFGEMDSMSRWLVGSSSSRISGFVSSSFPRETLVF